MASKDQIVATAIKLLQDQPHGLRYTQLHAAIRSVLPDANPNSVGGAIWNLEVQALSDACRAGQVLVDA